MDKEKTREKREEMFGMLPFTDRVFDRQEINSCCLERSSLMAPARRPSNDMRQHHRNIAVKTKSVAAVASRLPISATTCLGQQALYTTLKELESEISHHIHMENTVLYPRALEEFGFMKNTIFFGGGRKRGQKVNDPTRILSDETSLSQRKTLDIESYALPFTS